LLFPFPSQQVIARRWLRGCQAQAASRLGFSSAAGERSYALNLLESTVP